MTSKKLILGTVQFGLNYGINNAFGKPDENTVFEILDYAAGENITILDTADAYGNSQELIGDYHKKNTHQFSINTKFSIDRNKSISNQLHDSLQKLHVQFIDTYFYHQFEDTLKHLEFKNELNDLKKNGLIKKIGASIYTNEQFYSAIENEEIDVIQIPFNLLDNFKKRGNLLKGAKKKNKEIHARSIFLQGLFFKETSTYSDSMQPLIPYINQIKNIVNEEIESIALRYAVFQEEIDYVVIGVDNKSQLKRNISFTESPLSETMINEINQIDVKETELLYPYNWK